LVPEKDLRLWCDVAERVHLEKPEAEFWIVGEGDERAMLERRMPAFDGKMRLFGQVPYSELPSFYSKASAFLLTSIYEGLGRVVVEAMLAEVPVVSVDIVGPRDLIVDGRTGRLVHRDATGLAEALIELLTDRDLARQISAQAHQWARSNYDFDAVAAKLVDSWEAASLLPRRRG
jgi:glycosyltransferase involved in cell wall biosynthesis